MTQNFFYPHLDNSYWKQCSSIKMRDKESKIALMKLPALKIGTFLSRPNRFSSTIKYRDLVHSAHIHDPGRLTELLVKNALVLFTDSKGKLTYYIKAVKKEDEWVIIDSSLHSKIALLLFKKLNDFKKVQKIDKEVNIGNSRIDFVLDGVPLEVKGVTLVENDIALFPDAPTRRGTRHIQEIIDYEGMIMFLVFRKANSFKPNWNIDKDFSRKLSEARKKDVPIYVIQLSFNGEWIYYEGKIPLADF
ncbi:MAG: DNA/RNA nuclease SfsA [Promethearchaeota archaeon]|nr:MAG: DNA/RNA nuclease SfsA [Candidatus Lokiarchaeota archaeon]